jgi:uncharacterized RDD family membrane protein YckC
MSDLPPPPPPPPPSEPSPGQAAGQLSPVGPWPRFGARIIDGLVLFIPNAILAAVLTDGATTSFGGVGAGESLVYLVVTTMLGYGYAVWLEASRGQTVGKMVLGYKVVGPDGRIPASDVAMRRNAWLLLGIVPFIGGVLSFVAAVVIGVTIATDPFKRGTHDNFAGGSAVVRSR